MLPPRLRASDPTAAGETTDVGPIGVNMKLPPHVIEHVQHDPDSLAGIDAVAGLMGAGEDQVLVVAGLAQRFHPNRTFARRL
jgi:hypothetical protein